MQKSFKVTVGFPLGVANFSGPISFDIDENILRSAAKKMPEVITISIEPESSVVAFDKDIDHGGLIIPAKTKNFFIYAHEKRENVYQIKVSINSQEDGAWDKDLMFGLALYVLALLNVFGYTRVSPILEDHTGQLHFHPRLTNLIQPGQDWFGNSNLLSFSLDKKIYEQASKAIPSSTTKDYHLLNELLLKQAVPLDWAEVIKNVRSLDARKVFAFGRVLSDLIGQHPGLDYVPMISTLTSYIEGLLLIHGEHRYKFSIKLSNLFGDERIAPVTKKIYDSRSDFFHTAVYKSPDSIFDFARIEFLLACLRKIFKHEIVTPINAESFDFPN